MAVKKIKAGAKPDKKVLTASGPITEAHLKKYAHLYAGDALNPEAHYRLVQNLQDICRVANIPVSFVASRMTNYCSPDEISWAATFPKHTEQGIFGMVYVGVSHVEQRIMSLCGALLRNYIDARVRMVQEVISDCKKDEPTEGTLVAIPNFYRSKAGSGDIATWDATQLYGWLFDRYTSEKQTVLYVQSMDGLKADYGSGMFDLIRDHYTVISA